MSVLRLPDQPTERPGARGVEPTARSDAFRAPRGGNAAQPQAGEPPHSGVRPTLVIRDGLVILLGALLYFWVRGLMHAQFTVAHANAERLIEVEQRFGLFHERRLQALVLGSDWLVTLANWVYIFGHWPVIVGTLIWLEWRHPDHFGRYRSALLLSGVIGLVLFVLVPMAPPRLLPEYGFVDTVTARSTAYRVLQPPAFTNPYAAMPSLHVGWNLLMGIAVFRCASKPWWKAFGVLMPLVMLLATVVTANHYLLDGVAGAVVALVGLVLAQQLRHRRDHRPPQAAALPVRTGGFPSQAPDSPPRAP
jgi:membrane-associated phospholipid phosphatase